MKTDHPLQHFVGKVCTIFTTPINRNYKEENPQTFPEPMYHYFTGRIESIDALGILVSQVLTPEKCKSYFFWQNLVGIAEEAELSPNIPEHASEIQKIKATNAEEVAKSDAKLEVESAQPKFQVEQPPDSLFINPESMSKLQDQMKQEFSK